MLVVSRRKGQTVFIGDTMVITVVEVCMRGSEVPKATVRLGITAPREILILRGKQYEHGSGQADKHILASELNKELAQQKNVTDKQRLVVSCKMNETVAIDETISIAVVKVHVKGADVPDAVVRLGIRDRACPGVGHPREETRP